LAHLRLGIVHRFDRFSVQLRLSLSLPYRSLRDCAVEGISHFLWAALTDFSFYFLADVSFCVFQGEILEEKIAQ
jgi:hypothetical protein